MVKQLLAGKPVTTELVCSYARVTPEALAKAKEIMAAEEGKGMPYFLQQRMQKEAAKQAGTATNTASNYYGKYCHQIPPKKTRCCGQTY